MKLTKELFYEAIAQVKDNDAEPTVAIICGKPYTLSELIEKDL